MSFSEAKNNRPHPLWSFSCVLTAPEVKEVNLPANLRVVPGVDSSLDYSAIVQKVANITY